MPIASVIITIVSIWPGVHFMESFLRMFPGSGGWVWCGWWYLPLAILSGPPSLWWMWKKSVATADPSALEAVRAIAEHLGARVEEDPPAVPASA